MRGRGLVIDNPNAPKPVQAIPADAARVAAGTLVLVDAPADERAIASVNREFRVFDGDGVQQLQSLPKDTARVLVPHAAAAAGG